MEILITLRASNSSVAIPFNATRVEEGEYSDEDIIQPLCGPASHVVPSTDFVEVRIGHMCFSIHESGLGQDFFSHFFRKEFPVSESARLGMIERFPLVFNPQAKLVVVKEKDKEAAGVEQLEREGRKHHSDMSKLFSITRTAIRYFFSRGSRRSRQPLASFAGLKTTSSRVANLAAHVSHRAQVNFHHLLLKKQWFYSPKSLAESLSTILIVLYFALLILLSLPPALLRKGIQKGVQLKNNCKTAMRRTLSRTTSFVKLAAPASADLKIYFK